MLQVFFNPSHPFALNLEQGWRRNFTSAVTNSSKITVLHGIKISLKKFFEPKEKPKSHGDDMSTNPSWFIGLISNGINCHLRHKVLPCVYTLYWYCMSRLEAVLWDVSSSLRSLFLLPDLPEAWETRVPSKKIEVMFWPTPLPFRNKR